MLSNNAEPRPVRALWRFSKRWRTGFFGLLFTAFLTTALAPSSVLAQTSNINVAGKPSLQSKYQEELDRWMLQAYEGDRDAQFKVGVLFTNDQFNSADFEQAVYWYKQAARQGHSLAQYNLGHQYLTGVGVKRSEAEAMKWWLKAAQQDHPLAQFNIGRGYYLGIGLVEDHAQSQYWFKRAAQNQEPKSIEILEQLGWAKPGEYLKASPSPEPHSTPDTNTPANSTVVTNEPPGSASTDTSQTTVVAASNQTATNEAPATEDKPLKSIAAYTNPAKRSVLIGIIDSRDTLSVVSRTPEWAVVTNRSGFPVWVSRDFIKVKGSNGTIIGTSVNARSVPLIANGTIVGQLDKGEKLNVLDQRNNWYRVQSPKRFKAWVKTEDLDRTINSVSKPAAVAADSQTSEVLESNTENSGAETKEAASEPAKPVANAASDSVNDNAWLFSQPVNGYTLQLASFDDPVKIAAFMNRPKFANNPDLHRFTSESKDIVWTYFLYGEFNSSESAKVKRDEIKQKLAWVRSFGKLQQSRCLAWKKQIPTPKELNKFCS